MISTLPHAPTVTPVTPALPPVAVEPAPALPPVGAPGKPPWAETPPVPLPSVPADVPGSESTIPTSGERQPELAKRATMPARPRSLRTLAAELLIASIKLPPLSTSNSFLQRPIGGAAQPIADLYCEWCLERFVDSDALEGSSRKRACRMEFEAGGQGPTHNPPGIGRKASFARELDTVRARGPRVRDRFRRDP